MSELVIRSARPVPVAQFLNPVELVRVLWRHRELIRQFAGREVLERHKGAYLGVAWNVVNPLITLAVYTFVFGFVFGSTWGKGNLPVWADFALTFFAGHTLFHVFAECANRVPGMVAGRPNLIRKVVFPVEILPVTVVLSTLVYVGICTAILLIVTVALTARIPLTAVFLPVVLVPLYALSLGVSWMLAAVGVFLKDMRYIVLVCTQLLMFMTPLFYKIDRIPESHALMRWIVESNPLSVIVENGRRALIWDEHLQWGRLGIVTLASLLMMQAGYALFMHLRREMADVH